ncbi:MAG TPA: caspase family protein [Sulfurimonas sp.]|nr:caspase family protein [Sulfurimonas sp.]
MYLKILFLLIMFLFTACSTKEYKAEYHISEHLHLSDYKYIILPQRAEAYSSYRLSKSQIDLINDNITEEISKLGMHKISKYFLEETSKEKLDKTLVVHISASKTHRGAGWTSINITLALNDYNSKKLVYIGFGDYMGILGDDTDIDNAIKISLRGLSQHKASTDLYSRSEEATKYDLKEELQSSTLHPLDSTKWLFIIGIEDYEFTASVPYASNSAKQFKEVMKKRLGIPENNIRALINQGATSAKINYKLKDMLRRIKKGDSIYFYYSGHGIPVPAKNNVPYLLAQDMNPAYIDDDRFQLQNIYKQLSNSKASKIIVFVDSCFSGGTDNQALIKGVAAIRIKPKQVTFDKSKMLIISAGSGTQYSNKYDPQNNRLFSYYLMRGLIQNNTNIQSLYNFVRSNVQKKSYEMGPSYEQVPVYDGNIKLGL